MTAPQPSLIDLEGRAIEALDRAVVSMDAGRFEVALQEMWLARALLDAQDQRVEAVLATYEVADDT